MASSKKSMSAKQLERMLGVTYESDWFLFHRLRECAIILTASRGKHLVYQQPREAANA